MRAAPGLERDTLGDNDEAPRESGRRTAPATAVERWDPIFFECRATAAAPRTRRKLRAIHKDRHATCPCVLGVIPADSTMTT
jgi:hypothetical protein